MSFKLLTDEKANEKLAKSVESEWHLVGLSLAPHILSGYNQCGSYGECAKYCIGEHAGMVVQYDSILEARIRKTKLSVENPSEFKRLWRKDMLTATRKVNREGRKLGCRNNIFSDRPWEIEFPELFTEFESCQFFDYTKIRGRIDRFLAGKFPKNYHLTYSISEKTPSGYAAKVLSQGGTVAMAINVSVWEIGRAHV